MIQLTTKYLVYLCAFLLITFPIKLSAGAFSDLKDALKQEFQKGLDQLNEDLQRMTRQSDNDLVTVPFLINKTPAQAENILQGHGLVIGKVIYQKSEQTAGTIISQTPPQNTQVPKGAAISVVVAQQQGNSKVTIVPRLIGLSVNEAQARLKEHALILGNIIEQSSQKPKGHIISQSPAAGQKIDKKSLINVVISKSSDTQPIVTLELSKNPITTAETLYLSTTIIPKPETKLQYSFTMNGKVYKSHNGQLSHRFQRAGRVIITASIRQKGQKWIHSKSQVLVVIQAAKIPSSEIDNLETLIIVPDVVGLPLDNAINQLKQAGLRIGHISQKITLSDPKVLQQTPKAGSRVKAGQKVDLEHSVGNKISLDLSVSTTEAKAHKPLEFHAELLSNIEIKPRKYTLLINGQRIDSSTPTWSYAFTQAGQYSVQAEVDIADVGVIQSLPINISVANIWVEPRAIIEPATLIIQQGDKANFLSQSTYDPKSKLSLLWMDEKGGSGTASQYVIDTEGWDVGEYWVTLRVKDEQGFEHTDQAELIIHKASAESTENTINVPTVEKTTSNFTNSKLSLSASAYYATIGKPIDFTITQQPAVNTSYTVIYGDGQREKTKQLWLKHSYHKMGRYFAYVISHYQDKQIQSNKIKIWILPSWLLIGVVIVALTLLLGTFKLLRSKVNKEIKAKISSIRYEPVIDQGQQKLEQDIALKNINTHIQFVGEKDKGKQRILQKHSERDEKNNAL